MPIANLPDTSVAAPIVALSPRVEPVVDPNAMAQVLAAYGNGQAVVQRAGQDSLASSQALNQMANANRAVDIQAREAEQNMALKQAQFEELMSPEQQQARRGAAIVQAIQAKEAQESAPERQLLDRYTRRAAISAAIAAPGSYDKKIQAILLHGGDTSGYDPDSLLPLDPKVKQKIDLQFGEVMKYDQWQAREDALKKDSKRFVRKLVNNETGQGEDLDFYDTPEGVMSKEDYDRRVRASNMKFPQWNATPDVKEPIFGSVEELAKSRGLTTKGTPAAKAKPSLGEVNPETGGVVTETGRKPAEPPADMLVKVDAAVSSAGDLIRIAHSADTQQRNRWLKSNWAPLIPEFIMAANPYDVSSAELLARINGILPQAARGIFGEVGVLTNADMDRYRALLTKANSPEQRTKALLTVFSEKVGDKLQMYSTMFPKSETVQNILTSEGFTPDFFQERRQRRVTEQGVPNTATALKTLELGGSVGGAAAGGASNPVAKTADGAPAYFDSATGTYYKLPSVMPR